MTKYTNPELRERLKEKIQASDQGGRPGQWSARKAQMLAHEYKNQGGEYRGGKDKRSKSLDKWTRQKWQTKEGEGKAETGNGMKRYLPEQAWHLLSDEQKETTEQKKKNAGKQFVANTHAARAARAYVDHGDATQLDEWQLQRLSKHELLEQTRVYDIHGHSRMKKDQLAHILHQAFTHANTAMTKTVLRKQAEHYGVNTSGPKSTMIHDIVHAAQTD